jgi:cytochrome c2
MPDRSPDKSGWLLAGLAAVAAAAALAAVAALTVRGTAERQRQMDSVVIMTGGNPVHGRAVIANSGCGACHEIPGLSSAGRVGPPLTGFAARPYIAGSVTNTPVNLIRWIQYPRQIEPSTAMPDLGLSDTDARDAAAYLLSRQ